MFYRVGGICVFRIDRQISLHECRVIGTLKQAGLISFNVNARGIAKFAVVQPEWPGMPGADGAAVFDDPAGQIAARVGAEIVQDVDFVLGEKDGKLKSADLDVFALVFLEFGKIAEAGPGH